MLAMRSVVVALLATSCAADADFMWGTATSAFQSEGYGKADGRTDSVWDVFQNVELTGRQRIEGNATAEIANHDYVQYASKTVPLLSDLGAKYYRLSISWTRVLKDQTDENPKGTINQEGIDHYKKLFASLKSAGIEPVVTMWHWDTPQQIEADFGGFLNRQLMPKFFAAYAKLLLENFGDDVKYWITLNEPLTVARAGYSNGGHHPPGRCSNRVRCKEGDDATEPYLAGHTMLISHGHAFQAFRKLKDAGKLSDKHVMGIALNGEWCEPLEATNQDDRMAAQRCRIAQVGWFFDPIYFGRYPKGMAKRIKALPTFTEEEVQLVKGSHMNIYFQQQYTGTFTTYRGGTSRAQGAVKDLMKENLQGRCDLNCMLNITHTKVDINGQTLGRKSDANNWLYSYPVGFRRMQKWLSDRYQSTDGDKIGIIVSENGWGHADTTKDENIIDLDRCNYFRDHIGNMSLAVHRDGVNVLGYFAWTLVDNFEWLQGYTARFGLTYMDYKTDVRTPKLSFRWMQKHVMSLKQLPPHGLLPPCSKEEFDLERKNIGWPQLTKNVATQSSDSKKKHLRNPKKVEKPDQISTVKVDQQSKKSKSLHNNEY